MFKSESVESSISTAIILNNSHQFKDDPKFGQILKRMWDGKFSQQDCNIINERLIGHKLQLLDFDDDADMAYACWRILREYQYILLPFKSTLMFSHQ